MRSNYLRHPVKVGKRERSNLARMELNTSYASISKAMRPVKYKPIQKEPKSPYEGAAESLGNHAIYSSKPEKCPSSYLKPGTSTTLLLSMLFFANTLQCACAQDTHAANLDTEKLMDTIKTLAWPTVRICNKPSNSLQATHAQHGDYFIPTANYRIKEKPCVGELIKLREIQLETVNTKQKSLDKANYGKNCAQAVAEQVNRYLHSFLEVNEFSKMAIANNKGNCDEMARLALHTLRQHDELKHLTMGLLGQINPKDDGHMLAIIFSKPVADINQKFKLTLKELAKRYPDAIIIDLWNGIKFPLKSMSSVNAFTPYVEARFHEITYDAVYLNNKSTIADIYRYYMSFNQHHLMLTNRPSHDCVKGQIDEIENKLNYKLI